MKKHKFVSNMVVVFLVAAMSIFVFTGCQSKSKNNVSAANGQQGQNGSFNAEARKQQMQDDINSLVSAGTITKDQGDKVLEALTANGGGFGGNGQRRQNGGQNGQNGQNNQQNNGQNNSQGGSQGNGQNGQRFNPLSKLVSDGVITQAQADAVMQKIRGNFQRPQNNQNNNQNNSQNNNQSTNQS